MNPDCFHRPGIVTRQGTVTCRNCGVAIEYCPCLDLYGRKCDPDCHACLSSMWVSIVRGRRSKIREVLQLTEIAP